MARPRPDAAGDAEFDFEAEREDNDQMILADGDDGSVSICSDDSGYERWLAINASPIDFVQDVDQAKSAGDKCSENRSFLEAGRTEDRVESFTALLEEKESVEQALLNTESSLQEKILEAELLQEENDLLIEQLRKTESKYNDTREAERLKYEEQQDSLTELRQKAADAIVRAEKAELVCQSLAKSLEEERLEHTLLVDRDREEKEQLKGELQQKIEEVALLKKTFESSKQSLSMQLSNQDTLLETLTEQLTAEKDLVEEELRQKTEELELLSEKFSAERAAHVATHQAQKNQARADQFEMNALLEVKDTEIQTLLERQTKMEQEMEKVGSQNADMTLELVNVHSARDESTNSHRKLYAELCDLFDLMEAKPSDDKRIPGSFPDDTAQLSTSTLKPRNRERPDFAGGLSELNIDDMLTMMTKRLLHLLDREDLCGVLQKELADSRDRASLADLELQQVRDEFQRFRVSADSVRNNLRGQSLQAESEMQNLQEMISQLVSESEIEKMALREEKENIADRLKQFEAQYIRLTNERADLGRESDKRMDKLRKESQKMQEEVRKAALLKVELTEKNEQARRENDRVNKQLHNELDQKNAKIKELEQQKSSQAYSLAPKPFVRRTGRGICQICFKPECPLGDSFSYYA